MVIRLSLDATNVQREKLVFELVKPYIPGFSVDPMDVESADAQSTNTEDAQATNAKRKTAPTEQSADDVEMTEAPAITDSKKQKSKKNKKSKK